MNSGKLMDSTRSEPLSDAEMKAHYHTQLSDAVPSKASPPANAWTQGDIAYKYVLQELAPLMEDLVMYQQRVEPLMNHLEGFPHGYIQEVRKHLSQLSESLYSATAAIHRIADAPDAPQEAVSTMPVQTLGSTIGSALRR